MADDRIGLKQVVDGHHLDETLNYQLVSLSNKLSLTVARRALAEEGVTLREWRVLVVLLIYGPSIARRISDVALLDPAHVSRTVHQMKKRGVVRFRPNEDDRRQIIVELTEKGDALARQILPRAVAVNDAFRELYAPDEYRLLVDLLARANAFADQLLDAEDMPLDAAEAPRPNEVRPAAPYQPQGGEDAQQAGD